MGKKTWSTNKRPGMWRSAKPSSIVVKSLSRWFLEWASSGGDCVYNGCTSVCVRCVERRKEAIIIRDRRLVNHNERRMSALNVG